MKKDSEKNNGHLFNFEQEKAQKLRLANPDLNRALYGLIAFFEDQQIRDRQGHYSSLYHSSQSSFSPKSKITLWSFLNKKQGTSLPMFLKVRNKEGEWASQMHALPKYLGNHGKTLISVQDSNLFITGFCSLPLHLISEQELPITQRIIQPILSLSFSCVKSFKRGNAYNFWPKQDAVYGKTQRTGPFNIWVEITNRVVKSLIDSRARFLSHRLNEKLNLPAMSWLINCLNGGLNANGADAIFNICNDADDSSMALCFEYLFHERKFITREMETVIQEITSHRDLERAHIESTPFEVWKGEDTGAYLTWLKKESRNVFSHAQQGLIPTGKNNVDIVVNANVLFTLSLLGKAQSPGYNDCIDLLCKAVAEKSWPGAGLYYPQTMMFPYVFTRAIRDGGAYSKKLMQAQEKLLLDLLALAKHPKQKKQQSYYYFEGGLDESNHLSTALALITLLNLGEHVAKKIQHLAIYKEVLEGCMAYLLSEVHYKRCLFDSTKIKFSTYRHEKFIAHWEDGLFFGPVHWDLCHWRSQAVTQACIFEAFSKYVLAYDKETIDNKKGTGQKQNKLSILSYELAKQKQGQWLKLI